MLISESRAVARILLILLLAAGLLQGCGRSGGTRHTADGGASSRGKSAPDAAGRKPGNQGTLKATFHGAEIAWDDDNGRPIWKAQFEEATASQTGGGAVVEITGVEASLYRNGKLASRLVAPRVVADSRTREVTATGGVKVTSTAHKTSARADRLVWKSREDKLIATGGVRMQRENLRITAGTLEADTSLEKARFTRAELTME